MNGNDFFREIDRAMAERGGPHPQMSGLFQRNRDWSKRMAGEDPEFFSRLQGQQAPEYFWIGCSDSRVPANQITGLPPGEMFVHRNVANVVVHTDLNCLAAMQFAVDVLEVKHIIVCGHYGCGGVLAALGEERYGIVDNWIRHVVDVRVKHRAQIEALPTLQDKHKRLCELNVMEQVFHVGQTSIVRDRWAKGKELTIHGWIYDLSDGLLNDLGISSSSWEEVQAREAESAP